MKIIIITLVALVFIQQVQAAAIRRQRRDLIGWNRQRNNGHIVSFNRRSQFDSDPNMTDLTQQILQYMSKNGNQTQRKQASNPLKRKIVPTFKKSGRLRRFLNYHN